MTELHFIMDRSEPCRAGTFLRHDCGISERQLRRLKATKNGITCAGRTVRSIDPVQPGEELVLRFEDASRMTAGETVPVLFQDADVMLLDKPAGMPTHPSLHHREDTLGNAFAALCPGLTYRPVNRLDRNTSGIVAAALHPVAVPRLPGALRKLYLAVLGGTPPDRGTVDAPIGRVPGSLIERCIAPDGKRAVTHFRVLARGERYTLAALRLETGRTHQIRVHMASIGCPLAGDELYGGDMTDIRRHALHCAAVCYTDAQGIVHPVCSPLPADLRALTGREGCIFTKNEALDLCSMTDF